MLHPFLHLQREMEKVYRDMNKYFFFILSRSSRGYRFFLAEMDYISGEMLHPFLHLQREMEKV
jgi:hypothetical protein